MSPSRLIVTLLACGTLVACEPPTEPDFDALSAHRARGTPVPHDLFERYAALGNSITAGVQSNGINDSTQAESYAILLARAFGLDIGSEFNPPSLTSPGCPPPLVNVFAGERVDGGLGTDCFGRTEPGALIHNVAVPGAKVIDVLSNTDPRSNPNPLTALLLEGKTQMEIVQALAPTFVTVWIGNNDVLGAAVVGDPTLATPVRLFAKDYHALVHRLRRAKVRGGVLVGVAQVTGIPFFSPGAAYWQVAQLGAFPPTLTVLANCGPDAAGGVGEATLVPFGYGFGVLLAQAAQGTPVTLDCENDPPVLTGSEILELTETVDKYNRIIARAAHRMGWVYWDPNPWLNSLSAAGEVPLFPNTTGLDAVIRPFGDWFSRDGVHPSGLAHQDLAARVLKAIEARYGKRVLIAD